MGILQERHGTHRVCPDHEAVSKIDVALALFAFEEKVGNRISMFVETLKQVSRSPDSIYEFSFIAKPRNSAASTSGRLASFPQCDAERIVVSTTV
jgi:hypothetical protein